MTKTTPSALALTSPPALGTPIDGGYFAGALRLDGRVYGILAAPKAQGEARLAWSKARLDVPGARSFFDGFANTEALADAGSPAARWARALTIAGLHDWYLPARDELELLYRAFKPTAAENFRYSGDNPSSVPPGYAYGDTEPAQTAIEVFREGGTQAFEPRLYLSSTQDSAHWAWLQFFADGDQGAGAKDGKFLVRAVRRFLID